MTFPKTCCAGALPLLKLSTVFAAFTGFAVAVCGWWDAAFSAWLATAVFGLYGLCMLRAAPGAALSPLLAFACLAATQFISGILIESGGYLSETRELGGPTGAFLRLALIYVVFFGMAGAVVEHYVARWRASGQIGRFLGGQVRAAPILEGALTGVVILGLLYLLATGLINGFPLFTGEDRYAFRRGMDDDILRSLLGNRYGAFMYLGAMLAFGRRLWFYAALCAAICGVSALLGDKFTELMSALALMAGPSLCRAAWGRALPLGRLALLGAGIACLTMPLVFVAYGGVADSRGSLERMEERMTLQGQLWFLADRDTDDVFRFDAKALAGDWEMMTSASPNAKTAYAKTRNRQGMNYLLTRFAPPSEAERRLDSGVVYCLGLHAYLLEVTGWAGVFLIGTILAALLGFMSAGTVYAFTHGKLVYLAYFAKFLTFWMSAFILGDLYYLFNWKVLAFSVSFGLYRVFDRYYLARFSPANFSST